jgi:hypothetical protein
MRLIALRTRTNQDWIRCYAYRAGHKWPADSPRRRGAAECHLRSERIFAAGAAELDGMRDRLRSTVGETGVGELKKKRCRRGSYGGSAPRVP